MSISKSNKGRQFDPSRGTPGNYVLNQKTQKFGDRRTKRNRDRSSQNRRAIRDSNDN